MRVTLCEALEAFLLSLEAQGRSDRTIDGYRERLSTFLEKYGSIPLPDITSADVDAWLVSLRRQKQRWGRRSGRPATNGGLSVATIATRLQSLKTFLKWCVVRDYLTRSPADHLKRISYNQHISDDRMMSEDDFRKMKGQLEADITTADPEHRLQYIRDRAIFMFCADTAARVGEIATLTLDRLDLENLEAWVYGKTAQEGEDEPEPVDFTARTAQALREWLAVRPDSQTDYVFVGTFRNHRGLPLKAGGITQMFGRLGERAGATGRTGPHSVRHKVGDTLVKKSGDVVVAQKKLRHSSPMVTLTFYAHPNRDDVRRATEQYSLLNDE